MGQSPIPNLEFVTGKAGTGKTYLLKKRIIDSRKGANEYIKGKDNYGTLCATTGIAAVNLGGGLYDNVVTIHSTLGYFDTDSLRDAAASDKVFNALVKVANQGRNLIIDEVSMLDAEQLDIIYGQIEEVNQNKEIERRGGLGLVLAGDFCQLPPIASKDEKGSGRYAFEARCWPKIADHITRLEKVWRQDNLAYLEALNYARGGDGEKAAESLQGIPSIQWRSTIDTNFEGTTIVAVNREVDRINNQRLLKLLHQGKKEIKLENKRWGRQRGEWRLIPETLELAEDAYGMILSNDSPNFAYANGDCGYIKEVDGMGLVWVELVRTGVTVGINKVTRQNLSKIGPNGEKGAPFEFKGKKEWMEWIQEKDAIYSTLGQIELTRQYKSYLAGLTLDHRAKVGGGNSYFDFVKGRWILGEITYYPLRLAYASTVHKSQGLSLDRVQIDFSHHFFGEPSMSYVALSRCRDPKGLVIRGDPRLVEMRTNIREEILPWI